MKQAVIVVILSLLSLVFGAPVEIKQESKRRETTRETLELENALKRLAGENKKFVSGPGLQPVPQVDGLEDHLEDDLVASLPGRPNQENEEEEQDDEPTAIGGAEDDEVDETKDDNLEPDQEPESDEEDDLDHLSQLQSNAAEDQSEEVGGGIPGDREEQQEQDGMEAEAVGPGPSDYDDASQYLQQSPYDEQQQGLGGDYGNMQYRQDYPAYGDGSNEDFLVQDVMDMMEKHPELWARLVQAKNMNLMEEEEEPRYDDLYDQLPIQQIPGSNQRMDGMPNPQDPSRYGGMQSPNELYNEDEALRNMQQLEKLQDFYGDKTAHVVAKKQGFGPVIDYPSFYQAELLKHQNIEGSGESESPVDMNSVESNGPDPHSYPDAGADNEIPVFKIPVM